MDRDHTSVRSLINQTTDQIKANRIESELRLKPNIEVGSAPPAGIRSFRTSELLEELLHRNREATKPSLKDAFLYGREY